jgi:hypothetical protein
MSLTLFQERIGDAPLIARTLTYLINDMMAELKNIDQLAAMQDAYSTMKASLINWLDEKPDLVPLQTNRKNFKSLKSKLRHKLADKHDVEEVCILFSAPCASLSRCL